MGSDKQSRRESAPVDVREVARRILEGGPVVEVETLSTETGAIEPGGGCVRVRGDVLPGALVYSPSSLVVEGNILGTADRPCQIQVDGDAVVLGSIRQATIHARRIWLGKGASRCSLSAEEVVEVTEDLVDVRIVVGDATSRVQKIGRLKHLVAEAREEVEEFDRQLSVEQRRMDRLFHSTRVTFNFRIGRVVRREANRVLVNLEPLYEVVKDKTEEEVERALLEFFAKAVVGMLTRVNQHFIAANPNHRTIFMTVIRKLHDLFLLTRRRDLQGEAVRQAEARLRQAAEAFASMRCEVSVGGGVLPEFDLQMVRPMLEEEEDSEAASEARPLRLLVRAGADSDQREVVRVDATGEDTVTVLSPGDLEGLRFRVEEDRIAWGPRG